MKYDAAIVGGGASGLFCGALLSEAGLKVVIFEPNRDLGRKLRITGKGRCNLTNNCTAAEVMKNIPRNPKFLYSALSRFAPADIMAWFEGHSVPLVTERGRRVFPQSGSAHDVAEAMANVCRQNGVKVIREKAEEILTDGGCAVGVRTRTGEYFADSVVLAAGGCSYPRTGSDGGGYSLCRSLGHTVTDVRPSLVPIDTVEDVAALSGLTLKNVLLSLSEADRKKPVYSELGELTFTDTGISGPLVLTASCLMDADKIVCKAYKLVIDLKPALSYEQLDARLLRDISENLKGDVMGLLRGLMPKELAEYSAKILGFDKTAQLSGFTKENRAALLSFLKRFELTPASLRSFDEAIITRGGVKISEINPQSMESRTVMDLYFTGEIIDCDGFTGGYNLTIAFTTAHSAAENIIKRKDE